MATRKAFESDPDSLFITATIIHEDTGATRQRLIKVTQKQCRRFMYEKSVGKIPILAQALAHQLSSSRKDIRESTELVNELFAECRMQFEIPDRGHEPALGLLQAAEAEELALDLRSLAILH